MWLLETDWTIGSEGSAHVSIAQIEVEPLRIEVTADPAFVVGVLGMATIGQTLEEASITVGAADILGWTCTSAVNTSRHPRRKFHDEKLSDVLALH